MDTFHSIPTMDISPLRPHGLAKLGLKLPDLLPLVDEALFFDIDWTLQKFAHREHGEVFGDGKNHFDPSNIQKKVAEGGLDYRLIVRQEQSGLKQESWLGSAGNIALKKTALVEYIYDALGDNAKYFGKVFFLKMDTDQGFIPHKDGGGTSRLYIPISPIGEKYSRLEFYHNNQIYYVYNYETPPPVYLFSSRLIHAVFNYGYPERINLQINCKLPYAEALALLDES